jgi:hypothetical protein
MESPGAICGMSPESVRKRMGSPLCLPGSDELSSRECGVGRAVGIPKSAEVEERSSEFQKPFRSAGVPNRLNLQGLLGGSAFGLGTKKVLKNPGDDARSGLLGAGVLKAWAVESAKRTVF